MYANSGSVQLNSCSCIKMAFSFSYSDSITSLYNIVIGESFRAMENRIGPVVFDTKYD